MAPGKISRESKIKKSCTARALLLSFDNLKFCLFSKVLGENGPVCVSSLSCLENIILLLEGTVKHIVPILKLLYSKVLSYPGQ